MVKKQSDNQDRPAALFSFKLRPLCACIRLALAGGFLLINAEASQAASPVLPVASKDWVKSGSATKNIIGNTLNVNQKSDKAILHWNKFDIGANNQVKFQQPKTTSIALNRIFQNNPSKILGRLSANGQLYLVNQNGFVFGKNSIVNTNTLVASTLNISDDVFAKSGLTKTYAKNGAAALESDGSTSSSIQIQAGAKLHAGENGRIILAAPSVTNAGDLSAGKNSQIMLIASKDKVYLTENIDPQAPESQKDFAGLLVEVGTGGEVNNLGNILSRQGNVTLAGFAVNQKGRVNATTSTKVNGSIRLLARQGVSQVSGGPFDIKPNETIRADLNDGLGTKAKVTFGSGSKTEILPDQEDVRAIDEQKQPQSYLEVSAHTVRMQSGSSIRLPGGKVDMTATGDLINPTQPNDALGNPSQGRIILEKGSIIDVSGAKNINASVERNIVDVPVQSFELRNSPRQKGGVLQGQTVRVDIRKKTPIIDTSGAEKRIERHLDERLGKGGTINLTAGGNIVVESGATTNISGGAINYQGGFTNTTKLLTDYGEIVDIGDADPNQRYQSVLGSYREIHQKWGVSRVWQSGGLPGPGNFEQSYLQGLDAGRLIISTPSLTWKGDLIAGTASGFYQRTPETRAFGGAFVFNGEMGTDKLNSNQRVVFQKNRQSRPAPPEAAIPADDSLNEDQAANSQDLVLSTDMLNRSGLQELTVKTTGEAVIAEDAAISMSAGRKENTNSSASQFKLTAKDIDIKGGIYAPGGEINLASGYDSDNASAPQSVLGSRGRISVAANAQLTTSGRWINDFALGLPVTPTEKIDIDAGKISLLSAGNIDLNPGSTLKADAGAWLSRDNGLTPGKAGSISYQTVQPGAPDNLSSSLKLNGYQSAYGLSGNGRLAINLTEGNINIGGSKQENSSSDLFLGVTQGKFDIPGTDGFGEIKLQANSGELTLKPQTTLKLTQQNPVLNSDYPQQASSDAIAGFSNNITLPDYLRKPVDLSLTANTNLSIQTDSRILGDNKATISLNSTPRGNIYVDGLISAPAGKIDVAIKGSGDPYRPAQIWLGNNANLQAQGASILNPLDAQGRRTGSVLDGGEIRLIADTGYTVIQQGARLDVSGTKTTLDIVSGDSSGIKTVPAEIASNAGKITLQASEGIVADGELRAKAGGPDAKGGLLELSLNRLDRTKDEVTIPPSSPLTINVSQRHEIKLNPAIQFGHDLDDPNLGFSGNAAISSDAIQQAGFDDLRLSLANVGADGVNPSDLNTSVNFKGDVTLNVKGSIAIEAPVIKSETDGALKRNIQLNTAYLKLGKILSSFEPEVFPASEKGGGHFTAFTQWTEFNNFSQWTGFDKISFNSRRDIRAIGPVPDLSQQTQASGELITAADINLTSSQIYPATQSKFAFTIDSNANPDGRILVSNSGHADATPLSAGGELFFNAPRIQQNGTVKAPFGRINLTAGKSLTLGEGSLTSVSGDGRLVPFGELRSGQNWVYSDLVFKAPPEKKLVLSAPEISLQTGSTVDLSGGGDLLAYEFQPGIGGSSDYLGDFTPTDGAGPNYKGGFAVLPNLGSELAPFDPLQSSLNNYQYSAGSQVYLNGSGKLAAGLYTILPARYALLPGALLVTPQTGTEDQRLASFNTAGLPIVGGYVRQAGTGAKDSRWSGFLIEDGKDIRLNSQYAEVTANQFFTERAGRKETPIPFLPKDSGQIVLKDISTKLALDGKFNTLTPAGGRSARMDIAADRLSIVNQRSLTPDPGNLEVLADDLNALSLGSLFLGGERSNDTNTGDTELNITSSDIVFNQDVQIKKPELLVAAKQNVTVKKGAALTAEGGVNSGDKKLLIKGNDENGQNGDGALLRLSGDNQVSLLRANAPGETGSLSIEAGAKLKADKSMLLDASNSTSLSGDISMAGGSLKLSGNTINLGGTAALQGADALNLSAGTLAGLNVDELILAGRDSINFYGNLGIKESTGKGNPLTFNNLVLDSSNLFGFGSNAMLQANNTLQLQNTSGKTVPLSASPGSKGTLTLLAQQYRQGDGEINIQGFDKVNLDAATNFTIAGNGKLNANAGLSITSGYITAQPGKKLDINNPGHHVLINSRPETSVPEISEFGGQFNITAGAIGFNGKAVLPSGTINLHSLAGDINFGPQSEIDLAGRKVRFGDAFEFTRGGNLTGYAEQGKIKLGKGSSINLAAGGDAAASGVLALSAPSDHIELLGKLYAPNGNAKLDVAGFSVNQSFGQQMAALNNAGFSKSVSVRSREDDITLQNGQTIRAEEIRLTADKGNVQIAGQLAADAPSKGGNIALYAGDKVILNRGAALSAKGTGKEAEGGKILLSSTDNDKDKDNIHGIEIKQGSLIDAGGYAPNRGGSVTLRALRGDKNADGVDDDININPIAGTVTGFNHFQAVGVKQYGNADLGNDGAIDSADIDMIKADTDAYMSAGNMLAAGRRLGKGISLRPGIQINYDGDLALQEEWDLVNWRYQESPDKNNMPGFLAINATGTLNIKNSLTDGFITEKQIQVTQTFDLFGNFIEISKEVNRDILQSGESWSYQLTAGSDLKSADVSNSAGQAKDIAFAAKSGSQNFDRFNQNLSLLNTVVRTGTGDISLSASGNVLFGGGGLLDALGNPVFDPVFEASGIFKPILFKTAVYTAGQAEAGNRYGTLTEEFAANNYGYDSILHPLYSVGEYPLSGGDLTITANQDIKGAITQDAFQNSLEPWLVKQGQLAVAETGQTGVPTAWGIDFAKFSHNAGVFGGGKTIIRAGGNIDDLGVAMPTTGKPSGNNSFDPFTQTFISIDNKLKISGGGELVMHAGGNINGGSFHLGQGKGNITANGAIKGSNQLKDEINLSSITNLNRGPQLLLGDTRLNLSATLGTSISAVSDPLILKPVDKLVSAGDFFSYSANSALQLNALTGDVTIDNDTSVIGNGAPLLLSEYYPASLNAAAFNGSMVINNNGGLDIALFPSEKGSLKLFAQNRITTSQPLLDNQPGMILSDIDLNSLPSAFQPGLPEGIDARAHAQIPVHLGDSEPVRLITQQGNIENLDFILSKKAVVDAGRDLENANISIQHANPSGDESFIAAGRDIIYPIAETAVLGTNPNSIDLSGSGNLMIKAGRNIDLGTSDGINSLGNLENPNLQPFGANLTIFAGLNNAEPDYLGLEKLNPEVLKYSENYTQYQTVVTEFMRNRTGNPLMSTKTAFEQFNQLDPAQYGALKPSFDKLASSKYTDLIAEMKQTIVGFVQSYRNNPNLAENEAIQIFKTLKPQETAAIQNRLNGLANQILFSELNETGSASAADPLAGNQRGYQAIEALYPGKAGRGDINMAFSTIQTLKGGNIDLLAPGGSINVGLPVAGVKKEDNQLGIIASGKGHINAFLDADFNVNQSRVFALGGDDIMVWSSQGDIDAGRGAKSALAVSDPVYAFDDNGNLTLDFPPPVAGSGIRTAAPGGVNNNQAGNVGLYAPGGIVNAGEAGIGGNNVTISAVAVLGANNIQVGGVATGVPAATTVSLAAGLTGVSNVAANATQAAEASANMNKDRMDDAKNGKQKQLGTINVELIGFGA